MGSEMTVLSMNGLTRNVAITQSSLECLGNNEATIASFQKVEVLE